MAAVRVGAEACRIAPVAHAERRLAATIFPLVFTESSYMLIIN
jgi:hypothetical protein